MEIKRLLRIAIIFIVIYLLFGLTHNYITLGLTGDHSFFYEFAINKSDALFSLFLWPAIFLMLAGFGGGIIFLFIPLLLLIFFGWLAYYIEKKLFSKKV